jgi:tRNA threonylcarbamoyladenosine biosynthesis protein TsaB
MIILTLRTDKPEAEIGLYDGGKQLAYETWQAHRELAETIHRKIEQLLVRQGRTLAQIEGIVCFQGPGSFTGLRIGLTVANTLAYGLNIPIVTTRDPAWLETGIKRLQNGENDRQALPFYGADAHITPQKKLL